MKTPKDFDEPIIRSVSSIAEEKIYGFKRRNIFNPEITENCNIKCCSVTGVCGVKSESHQHPGDEVVFTLEGENRNYANNEELQLRKNQALAISPGNLHTTKVTGERGWKGVCFYCDQCPLIQTHRLEKRPRIFKKTLDKVAGSIKKNPAKQILFSPLLKETDFMELFAFVFSTSLGDYEISHKGETVYYIISGRCFLSWGEKTVILEPNLAAAIPAGFSHRLAVEDNNDCTILAGSCSSCKLLDFKAE